MSLEHTYNSNKNVVYLCKYHIIWCPKYRRKVLVGAVEQRLKQLIPEIALELDVQIIELETDQDYVHVLAEVNPQFGVNNFVQLVKGRTSRILRTEFPHLKQRCVPTVL